MMASGHPHFMIWMAKGKLAKWYFNSVFSSEKVNLPISIFYYNILFRAFLRLRVPVSHQLVQLFCTGPNCEFT